MSEHIDRLKLARASAENLVRLAKAIGVHGCACGAAACRQDLEEKTARELDRQSMQRHAAEGATRE